MGYPVMRNYTLLFPKENIIVGCDLDLFQSGKGQWEVMGGGKKLFSCRNAKKQYKMHMGFI